MDPNIYTLTMITPHLGRTTGGVYAIEQLTRYLSGFMRINLIVQSGDPRPVGNAVVYFQEKLDEYLLPDANAIVLHADSKEGEAFSLLPPSKGERFIYFQGYGTPGSEIVKSNLRRGFKVIASSKWLMVEAQRFGCKSIQIPYGIDTTIFNQGSQSFPNTNIISMMTHNLEWKGMADGLEAISIVREEIPGIEVWLFGIEEPPKDFPAKYFPKPTRRQIAEILRRSSVFVCSSWEEGFGMPGLEALACGAALATTDTKGNRDFAIDGVTALVTPAKCPNLLAQNILTILKDPELRNHLIKNGFDFVNENFESWKEAAQRFGKAIMNKEWDLSR
jgi:glycosyltransferase involved in cell wall biosynthesis